MYTIQRVTQRQSNSSLKQVAQEAWAEFYGSRMEVGSSEQPREHRTGKDVGQQEDVISSNPGLLLTFLLEPSCLKSAAEV
jgi:hypothetical protein